MDSTKIGQKISDLLSDNRIYTTQWRFFIPLIIVQQPKPVVINARLLAEGIVKATDQYGITIDHIPDNQMEFDWDR